MQIKAGFKKEWLQFTRTFRLGGILLGIMSFAFVDPLMYWGMGLIMQTLTDTYGMIGGTTELDSALGMLFGNAGMVYGGTMAELCSTSLLIVMLVLMSPCVGAS